jgi:hypothetical protein
LIRGVAPSKRALDARFGFASPYRCSISAAVMSLRERTRPGLGIIEPCLQSLIRRHGAIASAMQRRLRVTASRRSSAAQGAIAKAVTGYQGLITEADSKGRLQPTRTWRRPNRKPQALTSYQRSVTAAAVLEGLTSLATLFTPKA